MNFLSVREIAKKWGMSERSVRNYCATGRIKGAVLVGKTWSVPENAAKPERKKQVVLSENSLLNILREQKDLKMKGSIYHKTQIELTFNSNHIEGSRLTEEQTRYIYETNTIGVSKAAVNIDDIIETTNHFKCFDYILENADKKLTISMIKKIHLMLKTGTSDSQKTWFNVGEFKKLPNEVGGEATCDPEKVTEEIAKLLDKYNSKTTKTIEDIVEFHQNFEAIHPFQDGNGRVGRLIMFKECLANNIVPFIIDSSHKFYYYRGLKEWSNDRVFLIDTCLSAQDKFKQWLEYFKIKY